MLENYGNEDSVLDLVIEVLKPKNKHSFKFIDCGANKGNYSKKIIKKLNTKFKGYLIEPN